MPDWNVASGSAGKSQIRQKYTVATWERGKLNSDTHMLWLQTSVNDIMVSGPRRSGSNLWRQLCPVPPPYLWWPRKYSTFSHPPANDSKTVAAGTLQDKYYCPPGNMIFILFSTYISLFVHTSLRTVVFNLFLIYLVLINLVVLILRFCVLFLIESGYFSIRPLEVLSGQAGCVILPAGPGPVPRWNGHALEHL